MNNDLTKEVIIESWNNWWSEEFHKQWWKKTSKSTFNIIFLESAKSFSKRTSNTLNNPFTKFIRTYFEWTIKFKNKIIKILWVSIDDYLDENILLVLWETKEKINQILWIQSKDIDNNETSNNKPTKDELINSWNNGWAEDCLKIIREWNSFHKAFLVSARKLEWEEQRKLKDFSQKYDMCYSIYAFAHAISIILTIDNKSTKIELILKTLYGVNYDKNIWKFRLAQKNRRMEVNREISRNAWII